MGTNHDCKEKENYDSLQRMSCRPTHWETRLTSGEPYTLRGVRTVRRRAFGNLS